MKNKAHTLSSFGTWHWIKGQRLGREDMRDTIKDFIMDKAMTAFARGKDSEASKLRVLARLVGDLNVDIPEYSDIIDFNEQEVYDLLCS